MTQKLSTRRQLRRPHLRLTHGGLAATSKPLLRIRLPQKKRQILSSGGGVASRGRAQLTLKLKGNRLRGRLRRLLIEKKQLASLRVDAGSDALAPSPMTRRSNPGLQMSVLSSTLKPRVAAEIRATRDDLTLLLPSSNRRTGEGLPRVAMSVTTGSVPLPITTTWVARFPAATTGDGTMPRATTRQLTSPTRTLVAKEVVPHTHVGEHLTELEKATATCLSIVRSETRTSASTSRM